MQSSSAIGNRDGMFGARRLLQFVFELNDLLTHRQPAGTKRPKDRLFLIGPKFGVEERYAPVSGRHDLWLVGEVQAIGLGCFSLVGLSATCSVPRDRML